MRLCRPIFRSSSSFESRVERALPQKSGFTLGGGQYRNAVASGRSQGSRSTRRYRVTVLTVSNNDFLLSTDFRSSSSFESRVERALFQKSGFTLGGGQYRNAVASGRSQGSRSTRRYRVTVLTVSNNDFDCRPIFEAQVALSQESREPCLKSQDLHLEEVSTATR